MSDPLTTDDDPDGPRTDPRVDRTRAAVLAAARDLLINEGWDAVTQLRVAEAAGVGRATMYRHWPERAMILYDVLAAEELELHFEPTEDLRGDLVEHLERLREAISDEAMARVITAMIDRAEWEEPVMDIKRRLAAQQVSFLRERILRAMADGTARDDIDADLVVAQLFGPVVYRRLVVGESVDTAFVTALVDGVLDRIVEPARRR